MRLLGCSTVSVLIRSPMPASRNASAASPIIRARDGDVDAPFTRTERRTGNCCEPAAGAGDVIDDDDVPPASGTSGSAMSTSFARE
jgi:hypothetical protein